MSAVPRVRTLLRLALGAAALLALLLLGSNAWISWRARELTFRDPAKLPHNEIGLVLGTSPRLGAAPNPFFEGRMDAAARLFHSGKVRHLLLSGDNGTRGYDEPTAMKNALVARGIPDTALDLDFAGFRTLDSVARAHTVFGVHEVTIISDDFHLPRSLFLAESFGLKAIGFSSAHLSFNASKKTLFRETLARVAAVADVYLLNRQPRFYGPRVELRLASGGELKSNWYLPVESKPY